jgi:DNA-binding NtrC family response regulator
MRRKAYDWPENVRELQNDLERRIILSEGDLFTERSLALDLARQAGDAPANGPFPSL